MTGGQKGSALMKLETESTMDWRQHLDPVLNVEEVAARLNVTKAWVWDHSSRKLPYLPVIRMSDGFLRYRRWASRGLAQSQRCDW